ncbi:hypothetical protein TcWFU_005204 [Taenia crassiceps]|uniref:DUF4200 domain-containing protein n=1 Tax=Taenia crassiceps TaxID=6207 RepID=A0ABR4Q786_9CEST
MIQNRKSKNFGSQKQSLQQYLLQRREMALLNCSINAKQEEIRNMQRIIAKERRKLDADVRKLKRDEAKFEECIKESEKELILAIIRAEEQAKRRMEKAEELRILKAQYLQLQTEICRNDVKLHDYRGYQRFLESLVKVKGQQLEDDKTQSKKDLPQDVENIDTNLNKPADERQTDVLGTVLKAVIKFQRRLQVKPSATSPLEKPSVEDGESSSEESFNLKKYFKEPSELIDLIKDLEVSNLSLIQNCQDAEEIIESLRRKENAIKAESAAEVKDLVEKMNQLKEVVLKKDNDFIEEFDSKLVSEEVRCEEQQFQKLCGKVAYVYEKCGLHKETKAEGATLKSISAVTQFAQIEAHLTALLTSVAAAESASPERVAALRHSVRAARRNEFRRQQREVERRRQEERNQRILQRAQAPPPPPRMISRSGIKELVNGKKRKNTERKAS